MGTLKNQPNKMGMTPQYFYTIPTSRANLPTVCLCLLVVCRRGLSCTWKAVVWVCSTCVVVHSEWVVLLMVATLLLLSVAGMVHVVCRSCGVDEEW